MRQTGGCCSPRMPKLLKGIPMQPFCCMGSPFKGLCILEPLVTAGDTDPGILPLCHPHSSWQEHGQEPGVLSQEQLFGVKSTIWSLRRVMHVSGVFLPLCVGVPVYPAQHQHRGEMGCRESRYSASHSWLPAPDCCCLAQGSEPPKIPRTPWCCMCLCLCLCCDGFE